MGGDSSCCSDSCDNNTVLGMRSLLRAKKNAVGRENEGQRADEASPARCRGFGFGKRRKSVRRHITRVCATAEEGKEDGDQGENFRGKEKSPQHLVLGAYHSSHKSLKGSKAEALAGRVRMMVGFGRGSLFGNASGHQAFCMKRTSCKMRCGIGFL